MVVATPVALAADKAVFEWVEYEGVDAVFTSVQGVLGPKNMSKEQLAYWEGSLEKISKSKEWNEFLEKQLWTPHFRNSKEMKKELQAHYTNTKELLQDLKLTRQ